MFERFAPGFGPLPREAYRQFMKHVSEHDLGSPRGAGLREADPRGVPGARCS